jgi:ABC-type nickel/cobalt efflux system permease component RcnA
VRCQEGAGKLALQSCGLIIISAATRILLWECLRDVMALLLVLRGARARSQQKPIEKSDENKNTHTHTGCGHGHLGARNQKPTQGSWRSARS